jgi:hypothetical protein
MNRRQQENGHPRARPSRARAAAAATREQGGPQSRAQGPPCQFAAAWVWPTPPATRRSRTAATTPPQPRSLPSLPCKTTPRTSPKAIRSSQGDARAIASTPDGHGRCSHPPPMAATARFAASFCRSPGLPLSWAALGQLSAQARSCRKRALWAGAGRPALLPNATRLPKAAQPGYGRALGGALVAGSKRGASSKAQNCIGRQQGSLFPAPLHSTVWATTKNWTRQRRK